ncbi:hypothetical protein [Helicobacter turcicus]|uniref:Outer membrane beta-barrel protein n=1 Tax=Helicobacter turcicus TaxID=2867412 RepID=A0ABS7JN70_9HELI|nr:hypothetical protein [Helicobacter turcicus]MBX7490827.1 hypothetical protein [Helicobacter turcicus]MBX7545564.1 hypothetical protein [Helicobacter turcicus]
MQRFFKIFLQAFLLFIFLSTITFAWQPSSPNPYHSQNDEHPLYTERKKRLLGVYGTYNKAKSDATLSISGFETQNHSLSEKQLGVGIQFGYLLNSNNRILANFEHHLKQNGFSYQLLMLGYAFTPQLPNSRNWRLLLGVNAGLALGKFDSGSFVVNDSALEKLSYTGLTYGIKGGLIRTFSNSELEFGIQARRLNFGEKGSNIALNGNPSSANLDLSETSTLGVYLGYNILF